jgi:L-fuculose-phosphate aldolase
MGKKELALRQEIISTCLKMNELGVNQGTSGNVSARWKQGILITPTGIAYDTLSPEDLVWLGFDGSQKGNLTPSSEWRFHLDITRSRDDVQAIVHTHSNHATALAIQSMEIPAIHYMVAVSGGPSIRVAPYATFGTQELSDNALKALEGRTCCLLEHHGVIATGSSVAKALWLAVEIETIARQYLLILSTGKTPRLLPDEEIERVLQKMKGYGLRNKSQDTP